MTYTSSTPLRSSPNSLNSLPRSPGVSPVTKKIFMRQMEARRTQSATSFGMLCLLVGGLLFIDIRYLQFRLASLALGYWPWSATLSAVARLSVVWELTLLGCAVVCFLYACYVVLLSYFQSGQIVLSTDQRKLLGVGTNDTSFAFPEQPNPTQCSNSSTTNSPALGDFDKNTSASFYFDWLFNLKSPFGVAGNSSSASAGDTRQNTPSQPYSPGSSFSFRKVSNLSVGSLEQTSPYSSFSGSPYSPSWRTPDLMMHQSFSPQLSPKQSLQFRGKAGFYNHRNFGESKQHQLADQVEDKQLQLFSSPDEIFAPTTPAPETLMRLRHAARALSPHSSFTSSQPGQSGGVIESRDQLITYLNKYEDSHSCYPATNDGNSDRSGIIAGNYGDSFRSNDGHFGSEMSPVIAKERRPVYMDMSVIAGQKYYLSTPLAMKSRGTAPHRDDGKPGAPRGTSHDLMYSRFGLDPDWLDGYMERLRRWIGRTIFKPVVKEINTINERLTKTNRSELLIGEASLSTLQHLMVNQSDSLPSLAMLLPYLEVSTSQSYVVDRIKTLAKDSCLGEFNWDGGGEYRGRSWSVHEAPYDATLVLHFVGTYLDSIFPPSPLLPAGKSFSAQFLASPSSESTSFGHFRPSFLGSIWKRATTSGTGHSRRSESSAFGNASRGYNRYGSSPSRSVSRLSPFGRSISPGPGSSSTERKSLFGSTVAGADSEKADGASGAVKRTGEDHGNVPLSQTLSSGFVGSRPSNSSMLDDSLPLKTGKPRLLTNCSGSPASSSAMAHSSLPPHFTLELGDEIVDPGKGHNNLWRTLILFLAYFDKFENSMIGPVSLGKSGLNIAWILNK